MRADLVLEGGGVLGLTFIGAYRALYEAGYRVYRIAGTSVGAFIASLIAAGFTPEELETMALNIDFRPFKQKTFWSHLSGVGRWLSLLIDKGLYRNHGLREWLDQKLKERRKDQFQHLPRLKVIATDVTKKRMLILPDDLVDYGLNPEQFSVALAVQMSTAIPYYFVPIQFHYGTKTSYIVDGGILSNFPIWIFDRKGRPRWPTFGLKIKDPISLTSQGKTSLIDYTKDLIRTVIDKDESVYLKPGDRVRTILIDYDESIDALNFDLSKATIKTLIASGYQSTKRFLQQFDFNAYCERYRSSY